MKVKWKVDEVATGAYRTFVTRRWPTATSEDKIFFMIRCSDEYRPNKLKSGDHGELTLVFRDDSIRGSKLRQFKKRFATLAELKEFVDKIDVNKLRLS